MTTTTHAARLEAGRRIFTRILVGVDGSQQALEAARQSALLQDIDGQLTLLAAWDIAPTILGGTGSEIPYYYDEDLQRIDSRAGALGRARLHRAVHPATAKLVRGAPAAELLTEIERRRGHTGRRRQQQALAGCSASSRAPWPPEIIHRAPCSVLVARPAQDGFPRRIVAGVDGSVESAAAYAAAHYLAERFDAALRTVVARWRQGRQRAARRCDHRRATRRQLHFPGRSADEAAAPPTSSSSAAAASTASARSARSPSASAHSADCSTLVVRAPVWQRVAEELGR